MPTTVRCFDYVQLDYGVVRNLLLADGGVFLGAATEAEQRASSVSSQLGVVLGAFTIHSKVAISVGGLTDSPSGPDGVRTSTLGVQWRAEALSGAFPVMAGKFVISPFTSSETHLDFEGAYEVPFGVLGSVFDSAFGRRIAEASVQRFVRTVAERLEEIGTSHMLNAEKVRATRMASESQDRFRLIAEHIGEVFWLSDPTLCEAQYVSPGYDVIWGVADSSMPGRLPTHGAAIHPDDVKRVEDEISISRSTPFEIEFRIVRPDGGTRWIRNRAFPIKDETGIIQRIAGIAEDITSRKVEDGVLQQNMMRLRALSAQIQTTREEERTRISREIHDRLGASLTCLKWDLEWLHGLSGSVIPGPDSGPIRDRLAAMINLTVETMHSVRGISAGLRPPLLDVMGLSAAIESYVGELRQRSGIETTFLGAEVLSSLDEDESLAAYRIVIEALTNVLRHAAASKVEISCIQGDGAVCITVTDDGVGLTGVAGGESPALGILGMKERARMVGGTLDIVIAHGRGTRVLLRIPVREGTNNAEADPLN